MMREVGQLTAGKALPPEEWFGAERSAYRLAEDLGRRGKLSVTHDLNWIAGAYRQRGWNLARCLDPRWWPNDSHEAATMILVLRAGDELLGCCAVRWIWLRGTLREMHESGRFFFGDYAGHQPSEGPGSVRVRVTSQIADQIAHCGVVYSCGLHVQDGLGDRVSWRLARLVHLLAGINWHWTWLIGRSEPGIARRMNEPAWGLSFIENGIYVTRGGSQEEGGGRETAYHLVGARTDHLRRQFQRDEYGAGDQSLADHLPLFSSGDQT